MDGEILKGKIKQINKNNKIYYCFEDFSKLVNMKHNYLINDIKNSLQNRYYLYLMSYNKNYCPKYSTYDLNKVLKNIDNLDIEKKYMKYFKDITQLCINYFGSKMRVYYSKWLYKPNAKYIKI